MTRIRWYQWRRLGICRPHGERILVSWGPTKRREYFKPVCYRRPHSFLLTAGTDLDPCYKIRQYVRNRGRPRLPNCEGVPAVFLSRWMGYYKNRIWMSELVWTSSLYDPVVCCCYYEDGSSCSKKSEVLWQVEQIILSTRISARCTM